MHIFFLFRKDTLPMKNNNFNTFMMLAKLLREAHDVDNALTSIGLNSELDDRTIIGRFFNDCFSALPELMIQCMRLTLVETSSNAYLYQPDFRLSCDLDVFYDFVYNHNNEESMTTFWQAMTTGDAESIKICNRYFVVPFITQNVK